AANFWDFLTLALENESHFLPSAAQNWRANHLAAEQTALDARARGLTGLALQAAFEKGFYQQAFSDHFLQDSYSAGHSGFARVASRPSVAGSFHDEFNELGRILIDARGRKWFGLGDGHLLDSRNELAY